MEITKAKPYLAVIAMQIILAGMNILSKIAIDDGMSTYIFIMYRHLIAFLTITPFAAYFERKRPKMTLPVFFKIFALSLLEPVVDQNLYYLGVKYTSATLAAAMTNIIPALTFILACLLRLEVISVRERRSQAKVAGTVVVVVGAMVMTIFKGPVVLHAFGGSHSPSSGAETERHMFVGVLLITLACVCYSCFMTLQAITLQTYDAPLSVSSLICLLGTVEGALVASIMERRAHSPWSIEWDTRLLFAVYTGVFCSGFGYYLPGVVMKTKGPVFVTTFGPLCLIIVAIMSYFFLEEEMLLGRVIGATVICVGLFMVVWGKSKDQEINNQVQEDVERGRPDETSSSQQAR